MKISEAFEAFEIDELVSEGRAQKTINSYRSTCNSIMRSLGTDLDVALFSYIHIIQWKKHMMERRNEPSHMALQLRELRRVLSYMRSHGFATLDPAEIKIPSFKYNKTAWFTIEELQRFLSAIHSPRDRALFACMFSSGGRISEVLSLNRGSIKGGEAIIYGKGRKEGKDEPEILVFDPNALMLLEQYLAGRDDKIDALFISRQSQRISVQQCIRLMHGYIKTAGIEKNGRGATHILRHSFGTDLELQGLDLHGISNQMRHKKLETTRIYLHGSKTKKKTDYAKFHTPVPVTNYPQSTNI
jgi:site-specific recombinase XerD